jgi:Fur family ferric uptake transcriptional regulator
MSELESIVRSLEARDQRVTPSRMAVLAAVLRRSGHFTVEDILRRVPSVGRATVFRTMKLLCELGIVCRVLLEDGSLHYRFSRRGHHHHLVCVSCGGVQDMDDCIVGDLVRELSHKTGYQIEGHWLELYGRCAACAPAAAEVEQ